MSLIRINIVSYNNDDDDYYYYSQHKHKNTTLSSLGQRHTQHGVCLVNESQEEFSTTEQKEFFHGTQMGQEIGILHNQ